MRRRPLQWPWQASLNFYKARQRRRQGRYDRATLQLFARAVRGSSVWTRPGRLLAYMQFLRDLGRLPPRPWLESWLTAGPAWAIWRRPSVLRLMAEGLPQQMAQTGLKPGECKALTPALAAYAPKPEWALLASVDTMQQAWRAEFAAWLQAKIQEGGICVTGNAASLAGQGLGPAVDAHAAVVRFNQFARTAPQQQEGCGESFLAPLPPGGGGAGGEGERCSKRDFAPESTASVPSPLPSPARGEGEISASCAPLQDVGQRLNVWVLSPGYRGPVPQQVQWVQVQWVVMAGPDVRYTLRHWNLVLPLLGSGARVLTVPLNVWRKLVLRLHAPPSAGVLLLQWLHDLNQGWQGISAAGIGAWTGTGAYHLALPNHQADSRHQWSAEHALVAQWRQQGLNLKTAVDRSFTFATPHEHSVFRLR